MTFSFGFLPLKIITTLPYMSDQNTEVSLFPLNASGRIHMGSDYLPLDIKTAVLGKPEFSCLMVWFGFSSTRHHQQDSQRN